MKVLDVRHMKNINFGPTGYAPSGRFDGEQVEVTLLMSGDEWSDICDRFNPELKESRLLNDGTKALGEGVLQGEFVEDDEQ